MCGIAGVFSSGSAGDSYHRRMPGAVSSLASRGPDGNGIYTSENISLGHTRLAIIDTSSNAAQPFSSADGRYTIIFNGEIFNYRELRHQLEEEGETFRSESDTEVLLKLFIRHDKNILTQLNGFFAFAIYDKKDHRLFIARDRCGEKPLYYCWNDAALIFASEIKALFALGVKKEINETSLYFYLQLNYVPQPDESMLQDVRQLPPATYLDTADHPELRSYYYWDALPVHESPSPPDYETAKKELAVLLDEAVQRRMISDVPLGAFLSGGIDSSIITALAARHTSKLHTFSIGFADEPLFDETAFALALAKKHKTEHTVFSLKNDDLFVALFRTLDYFDQPFADSSALAVGILSQRTRQHVTVALSGDGADEMFAGYNKHAAEWRVRNGGLKTALVKSGKLAWNIFPASRNSKTGNKIRQLRRFAEGASLDAHDRYWRWAAIASEEEALSLLKNKSVAQSTEAIVKKSQLTAVASAESGMNGVLRADMKMVLPGDMLVKVDRMSMMHGLEVRPPFLDRNVVDYVMRLPVSYKIDAKQRKKILRESFAHLLPQEILHRGKKGFEVPLLKWFRHELSGTIQDLLNEKFVAEQQIFDPQAVRNLLTQLHSGNPGDAAARVWALIVFQHWWKKYMM